MKYLFIFFLPYLALSQTQIGDDIISDTGCWGQEFITATSQDGNIVAVSTFAPTGCLTTGFVRVFQNISNEWIQIGSDISGSSEGDFGKSIAISKNGEVLAIGTPNISSDPNSSFFLKGQVDVYKRINNNWIQYGDSIIGTEMGDRIGWSLSLNDVGDRVAIGSIQGNNNTGLVRVYGNVNGIWNQMGDSIIHLTVMGYGFGEDVSFSSDGNRVAVSTNTAELVATFEYNGSNWEQYGSDIVMAGSTGNSISLSCDGTTLAVGDGYSNNWEGKVKFFTYVNGNWIQKGETLYASQNTLFGGSVSISCDGNVIGISETSSDINGLNTGSIYVYQFLNGDWEQIGNRIDGDIVNAAFGLSTSLSGNGKVLAIGGWALCPVRVYDLSLILNVDDISNSDSVIFYPNPAENHFTISIDNDILFKEAKIYTVSGKLISNNELKNIPNKVEIDISNLESGLYLVKLMGDKSSYTAKLIIQ